MNVNYWKKNEQVEGIISSMVQRPSTFFILKDTDAPLESNNPWHGYWIWNRLVYKEGKKTNVSRLQEIPMQPNKEDKKILLE